jgi:hypothetical protein
MDLPYFVDDLREHWYAKESGMDPVRPCNLIAFMAQLTALRVWNSGLSSLAIQTFKKSFEVERPPIDENASSNLESLTILVPECTEWIQHYGHKLLTLETMNIRSWVAVEIRKMPN